MIATGIATTIAGGIGTITTVTGITIADAPTAMDFGGKHASGGRKEQPIYRRIRGLRLPSSEVRPMVNWPNVNHIRDCGRVEGRPKIRPVYRTYAAVG